MNKLYCKRFCAVILSVLLLCFAILSSGCEHYHVFGEWETVEEASCEEEGLRVRTCSVCGETEEEILPKAAHVYEVDHGYEATCTATGLSDGAHCSVCGEVLVEQKEIPKVQHVLEDIEGVDPTFTQTGLTPGKRCSVCHEIIVPQHVIERLKEEDYGYKLTIGTDGHVSVYVYTTQEYEIEQPVLSEVAFSRDSKSGELTKTGNGQVNFELRFDDGYYLKDISLSSGYNALKPPEDIGRENTYRITKITNDLVMFVSSQKQVELLDFASYTNDNDGKIAFSWKEDLRIEYITVSVKAGEDTSEYRIDGSADNWTFDNADAGVKYDFTFTPYAENDGAGTVTTCSRYYNPDIKTLNFPRLEVTTQDYVWPSFDRIDAPEGAIGSSITNNNYVQCIVNLYDNNKSVYSSSKDSDFSKAKIKARGNTSAYYSDKTPYKIKLSKKADLLAPFIEGRKDKDYTNKEWVLLKTGYEIRQLIGSSIAETVGMDYVPAFTYCSLFLNGNYCGLYILAEAVNQGNGSGDEQSRCAVDDDGYIVELDAYWWNEDIYFRTKFTASHIRYTFKYPDPDDLTLDSPVVEYIKDYITRAEDAVLSKTSQYQEYIEEESFAKWILTHDLLASYDAAGTNMYVTKKDSTDSSKLVMPVVWDFDSMCTGNVDRLAEIRTKSYSFFSYLQELQSFNQLYYDIFAEVKDSVIDNVYKRVEDFDKENYNKLIEIERNICNDKTFRYFDDELDSTISWMREHIAWMEEYFAEEIS